MNGFHERRNRSSSSTASERVGREDGVSVDEVRWTPTPSVGLRSRESRGVRCGGSVGQQARAGQDSVLVRIEDARH